MTPVPAASKPLQIAHRGGAGLRPENTMAAFRNAIERGADGIELDVHLSRDRICVVHHDESLNAAIARDQTGQWVDPPAPLVKNLNFAELRRYDIGRLRSGTPYAAFYPRQQGMDGEHIPSLEEVYELVRRRAKAGFRLYVELKTALLDLSRSAAPEDLADAVIMLTRRMQLEAQVTLVSFDWRALAHAKRIAPDIRNAFTTLPFRNLDPNDPSARHDTPEDALYRGASAQGADFMAGYDWRRQTGASFAERMLKAIAQAPADGWLAWEGDVTWKTAPFARRLGLELSCWTVNEPARMQALAALPVDAIVTDRPDMLSQALQSPKKETPA